MKLSKMYPIIFLLFCFIIVPIILHFFNFPLKEGNEIEIDFSKVTTIDRIKTIDGSYAYCIAGDITCPAGNKISVTDSYTGGKTYQSTCDDTANTQIECQNNFAYEFDDSMDKDSAGNYTWSNSASKNKLNVLFSSIYKGFTTPVSNISVKMDGNYIDFFDKNNKEIDNVNKCYMVGYEKHGTSANVGNGGDQYRCLETIGDMPTYKKSSTGSTGSTGTSSTSTSTGSSDVIKCLADNDTQVGDKLCCGQSGVLQNTNYVCPYNKPTCAGFTCGSTFGSCS